MVEFRKDSPYLDTMNTLKAYFVITRPLNIIIAFISIFIGGFVTGTIQPLSRLLIACVSGCLIMAGANTVNDVFDLEIDRVNRPNRPLPSGAIRPTLAHIYGIALLIVGCLFAWRIHAAAFWIALGAAIAVYLYSWKLKGTVLIGNLIVSAVTGMAFVYGGVAVGRVRIAAIVGIFAFFFHWGREIIKDIEDMEGDRSQGLRTLPVQHGVRPALAWATGVLILLIGLTLAPYLIGNFNLKYLITVLIGVDLFLIGVIILMWKRPDPTTLGRLAFAMKLDMFIGLLAVYLGS